MDNDSINHHLSMWNSQNRKKSFKKWPFNAKSSCSVTKMVAAGFYHIPDPIEKDTARCFYCCRTICGFDEGDDPVEEHIRRSKDCKYDKFRNVKDLASSVTLYEYSQYETERRDNFIANTSLENPAPFEATKMPAKSVYKTPPTPAVNQEISDARRDQISDITKRITL